MTTRDIAADVAGVNPGLLGFVVVALLGVATWLLIRSMHRQLRKIDFEEPGEPREQPGRAVEPGDRSDGG
jgi:hypothetical protein